MKTKDLELTPLAAALVEAMPDRKKMNRIKLQFRKSKVCPVSEVFDADEVEAWYAKRGESIKAKVTKCI